MKETYNFEFWRWNFECDNFKQKPVQILMNTISGGRLSMDMKFESYGHIEFAPEDKSNRYPTISYLDGYTRSKTNCLIYNLVPSDKNKNYYDKCFIYHSIGSQDGSYGYVFYNTETKEMLHKYFITHEDDELCRKITESLNVLMKKDIMDAYNEKVKQIKPRKKMVEEDM
jgi:hypothetical protein